MTFFERSESAFFLHQLTTLQNIDFVTVYNGFLGEKSTGYCQFIHLFLRIRVFCFTFISNQKSIPMIRSDS
jgi:hypothetical protein